MYNTVISVPKYTNRISFLCGNSNWYGIKKYNMRIFQTDDMGQYSVYCIEA